MDDDGPAELVMLAAVARRHYLQNQSKVEIADALGISRGAVKSHASRGVSALRHLLKDAS